MVLMVKGMCNSQSLFSISLCIYIFQLLVYGDGSFHAEVVEESPVGTMIHGVAEFLNELKSEADVQYQLLGEDGVSRLLSLHPTTGQLRVRARIDRESLCPSANSNPNHNSMLQATGNPDLFAGATLLSPKLENSQGVIECVQTLNILLVPRTKEATGPSGLSTGLIDGTPRTSRILIHLVIRDINDNAPMWTQGSSLEIGFVETPNADFSWNPLGSNAVVSGLGTSSNNMDDSTAKNARTIDRAVDLDLGLNSTIIYRLLGPGAEYFRLDDSAQPNLDEVKLASKHPGYVSHTPAAEMRASPLQIRPIVPLDRETEDFSGRGGLFNLTLLATDLGLPPKTGSVILLIHVIDVNDHAPVFHNDLYQHGTGLGGLGRLNRADAGLVVYRPSSGTIRETVPIGSLIVQLNATDKDVGLHAKLVYDFCPCDRSAAREYFRVDHDTGRIGVIKPLDYDLGPRQFQFKVIAKDSAPEPYTLTGTALVEVTLTDENDEAPMIHVMLLRPPSGGEMRSILASSANTVTYPNTANAGAKFMGEYHTSIKENPPPESIIAYVQVTDRDHHGQDQVHCRLGPTDNFTLQLDPVGASSSPFLSSLSGHLATQSNYANSMAEASSALNRQDFRLVTETGLNGYANAFHPLDREVTPVQRVTITCTDSVGNAAYVLIHVNLIDVNDHEPEFVNGGQFAFQLAENEELTGGKPLWLGRILATDKDMGDNALITYQLLQEQNGFDISNSAVDRSGALESHSSRWFELDSQTGNLYAKTVFDREAAPPGGVYRLNVLAIDNGSPRMTGTATVEVFVLDVNDWAPQFTKDVYTFSVPEDARIQEVIGAVEAVDRDADSQGKITYQLVPNSRRNRDTEDLYQRESYKTRKHRQAEIKPDDFTSSNHDINEMQVADVTESVSDSVGSNIKPPVKSEPNQSYADFSDLGPFYAPVSLERNSLGYFSVDRLTGKIRLIRRLDRESIAFFSLEIVATDAPPVSILPVHHQTVGPTIDSRNHTGIIRTQIGPQSLSTTTTVVIVVTDVNDNAPVFRRPNTSTAIQLRLHETLGRQLLIVEATDADDGENSRVTYRIRSEVPPPPEGSGNGFFAIDESSGVLFLAKTLNSSTTHRLVIEACDNGVGATRQCTLSPGIRITVSDQDDPNADSPLYLARSGGIGANAEPPFDLDTAAVQRVNPTLQAGRRNELVIVCLVVVFSILLLATIVLVACLVHRRGARAWIMGRSNGSGADVPSVYGKDCTPPKSGMTGRLSAEPWLDENSHHDQADLALDTKFEACKSAQYDQPNDMKYLGRENLMNGAVYPISTTGYLPHSNAAKLISAVAVPGSGTDGQTMHLTNQMAPMRFRPLLSPPADYMTNALDRHGAIMMPRSQPSAEISELLTQSSYKPPSPDYQSLDVIWHHVPRPGMGPVNRTGCYRNPRTTHHAAYAMGHGNSTSYVGPEVVSRPDPGLLFNPLTNEMLCAPDTTHTYYEITGGHQAQTISQQRHAMALQPRDVNLSDGDLLDDWTRSKAASEAEHKSFTSAATLGRPATGKGKRRATTKGDSMYNSKAGELALHSNKKSTTVSEKIHDCSGTEDHPIHKSNLATEDSAYSTKPPGQYTYQAYREGTFV